MAYKISVIIPVYNAESFLPETLRAIYNQTIFEDLEIVIVNDGSTDKSGDICTEFSRLHKNVKIIIQDNLGVSVARNNGLKKSTGRYVTFLDADDLIESDLYERELQLIENNSSDIAICDFYKIHPDGSKIKYRNHLKKNWGSCEEALKAFFDGTIGNQVVEKLFKRSVVENVEFPRNCKIGEDMWFIYSAIKHSERVSMDTSIAGYYYVIRESSAMTGEFSNKYFDPVKLSELMVADCSNNQNISCYAKAHLIHEACKSLEYVYRHKAQNRCREQVSVLKKILREYHLLDAKRYLIKKQFYGFVLMRFSPHVYIIIHKAMKVG